MTVLKPLTDPYASVHVAVYEPLILKWISVPVLADVLVKNLQRQIAKRTGDPAGGPHAPTIARFEWRPSQPSVSTNAIHAEAAAKVAPVRMVIRSSVRAPSLPAAENTRRKAIVHSLLTSGELSIDQLVTALDASEMPHLLGKGGLHHALSPIGAAHLYRQLYFDLGAGLGPIEQAFTVAPKETMEVVQEVTRRDSVERTETFGTESTLEKAAEQTTVDEISDHVQTSLQRDMQIGVSASASGSIGVWSASAQGSFNLGQSSQRAREEATKRSVSQTKKSSETIRKSYSLSVKTFTEFSERSSVKRTLKNEGDEPVNYGLRRVLRTIRVKLQSIGPRLVWQLYVKRPGERLALSKMVMFRESDAIAPGQIANAPPKPQGGSEGGSQTLSVQHDQAGQYVEVSIAADATRRYTGLTVDSITDAAPDKDSSPAGVTSAAAAGVEIKDAAGHVIGIKYKIYGSGSAEVVNITYTVHYDPSDEVLRVWNEQVLAAQQAWQAQQQEEAFDRAKRLIVAKSRVRPRPAADLRDEERYEIMNRMISEAFHDGSAQALPSPVEIELFHRYFDVSAIFYYVHPAWWMPRYGAARADYEITDDSEPARFGKSLGWVIQLDGDRRRSEFLNSPWLRVCTPIRPGVEREAIAWLAQHIEGAVGYSTAPEAPIGQLLAGIEAQRAIEQAAPTGPDYVTLDGQVPPSRESSAIAYPVVDEFDVVVPTDGFVYDKLTTE